MDKPLFALCGVKDGPPAVARKIDHSCVSGAHQRATQWPLADRNHR